MADAFGHASGMAQSHAGGSVSGKAEADRYLPVRPTTPKPSFEVLYPERPRLCTQREQKLHVGGGVNQVEYEIVEDWRARVVVVSPYNLSTQQPLRVVALCLERVYGAIDGLDEKPWKKHADAKQRDAAVAKFLMSRMQLKNTPWGQRAVFVPRSGSEYADDGALEVTPPLNFGDAVFSRKPLLVEDASAPADDAETDGSAAAPTPRRTDDTSAPGNENEPPRSLPPKTTEAPTGASPHKTLMGTTTKTPKATTTTTTPKPPRATSRRKVAPNKVAPKQGF